MALLLNKVTQQQCIDELHGKLITDASNWACFIIFILDRLPAAYDGLLVLDVCR